MRAEYQRYIDYWYEKLREDGSPLMSISDNIGDYFGYKEWLEKPHLHNF